jgi:hypothetical protein
VRVVRDAEGEIVVAAKVESLGTMPAKLHRGNKALVTGSN